jgi:glutamine amidotransferase
MRRMCRWMAWRGQPLLMDELLYKTQHGLIDQSLHARMGVETTNGDGFGLGWYGEGDGPAVYHSVAPAWSDANLRELTSHVEARVFLAHVRATTGTAVQQTNCHPFRHRQWLFVHNGLIEGFHDMRRELMLSIDPARFADVLGSTDSEVLFHLALTFGLERDPVFALQHAIGLVEATAERHGVANAVQASIGVTDGEHVWAVRYSSEGRSRTLFTSADVQALRMLYPDNARLKGIHDDDRVIVSEPFADLPGAWDEVPESTAVIIGPGGRRDEQPFTPAPPPHVDASGLPPAPAMPA